MNIEVGSYITCKKGKKVFRALVTDSWYNKRGYHFFRLEILKRKGYIRTPRNVWYSRYLYKIVSKIEYSEIQSLDSGGGRFHKIADQSSFTSLANNENIINYFNNL